MRRRRAVGAHPVPAGGDDHTRTRRADPPRNAGKIAATSSIPGSSAAVSAVTVAVTAAMSRRPGVALGKR
jgi:hypothetical protein